jgi:hypothetical protein
VRRGINLHVLLADLQGSDIYSEGSDSSECLCYWLIFRDQTFIARGGSDSSECLCYWLIFTVQTAVSVSGASCTCLVTEVTRCKLQIDTEPDVGVGDRNCLLPPVTHCDGSDSQRGRCMSDVGCQPHIASRNMPARPPFLSTFLLCLSLSPQFRRSCGRHLRNDYE